MLPDDDANSSSQNDSVDQNPNPTTSIDQSLDAIEGQLTLISFNHHHSKPPIITPHPENIGTLLSDSHSQLEQVSVAENLENIDALPPDSHLQVKEVVAVAENPENIDTLVVENSGEVDILRSDSYTEVEGGVVGNLVSRGEGVLWRNNSDVEVEVEGQGSPSSSGYAGGKGTSSSSGISGSGIEEISGDDEVDHGEVVNRSGSFGGSVDSEWVPGKRHVNEVSFVQALMFLHCCVNSYF